MTALGKPKHDWAFSSTPQKDIGGRSVYQPRGRGLGGSSAVRAYGQVACGVLTHGTQLKLTQDPSEATVASRCRETDFELPEVSLLLTDTTFRYQKGKALLENLNVDVGLRSRPNGWASNLAL